MPDKGIPLADDVARVPQYAKEAYMHKGNMLYWQNKWPQAIAAYQSWDTPPSNLYQIAQCYINMGKRDQAIEQYREIENFFKDQAPEAAIRIAHLYRDTRDGSSTSPRARRDEKISRQRPVKCRAH